MQIVRCSTCGDSFPESASHCARCGDGVLLSPISPRLKETASWQDATARGDFPQASPDDIKTLPEPIEAEMTLQLPPKPPRRKIPPEPIEAEMTLQLPPKPPRRKIPPEPIEAEMTLQLPPKPTRRKIPAGPIEAEMTLQLPPKLPRRKIPPGPIESEMTLQLVQSEARKSLERDALVSFDETDEADDQDDEIMERHGTWQKVVEHKTTYSLPAISLSRSKKARRRSHWAALLPDKHSPQIFFWLSLIVVCALLLGGGFGVASSFGSSVPESMALLPLMFQTSPATIALGGIVSLRGTHFTPNGTVELSRDQQIPLVDTGNASSLRADPRGSFSDTVIVDPAWLAGPHTLYATDLRTHRQAIFNIQVTGSDVLQGPPYLLLSSSVLNLGPGDAVTNGSKLLAMSNAGGGQVTWQASMGQPWLQISPRSGSIASGAHLSAIVAVDRFGLAPGSYQTNIVFTSNTGQITLPVRMTVTPLQANHEAILQISAAALAFTGSAQGPEPEPQKITVNNPGTQTLDWGTDVSLQNGNNWLWLVPSAESLEPGGQQQITVDVSTEDLAPGVYRGTILFSNRGLLPIQGSPQRIYVSLTVTPPCTLIFAPASLGFTSVHGQASPSAQPLSIMVEQGCATSQIWTASATTTTGGKWLSITPASGSTPAVPHVSINTAGLAPGTYSGSLTLTVSTGPQIVPVKLTVSPVPCTISTPSTLALQATVGQSNSVSQAAIISSNGDCLHTLNWTSSVSGAWLSATSSGTLTQPSTSSVTAQADPTGLGAGTYTGSVTITAIDSQTSQTVSTEQISVTLTVLPHCTLQAASSSTLSFNADVGSDPTAPTAEISISVTGSCSGSVTITPALSFDANGSGWLTITGPVSISSGGTATFTITVTSAALAANTYTSTITLDAADGNGAILGSPQTVTISLTTQ